MRTRCIITRLLFSGHFLRERCHRVPHRGVSFKNTNRCEACHKYLIETFFSPFMNKRLLSSPDDRMSLTAGQLCKCGACEVAHSQTCCITRHCRCSTQGRYEWQVAALSDHRLMSGGNGAECTRGRTSDTLSFKCCGAKRIITVDVLEAEQVWMSKHHTAPSWH